ncbi:MAG: TorF family putative porin [Opitutaceae bacterium]|jgi:uncharacterized protein (TIGR02001 family)
MKKTILALAALAVGVSASAQEAAKTNALAVTLDVTYVSNYVFRAEKLSNSAFQPSVEAAYGDFYAGIWHSGALNNGELSETDLYVGYNLAINDTFFADIGATRYTYKNVAGNNDATEAFAGVKANVFLSPSVYYYYDFDNAVSSVIGSIGHSVPVEKLGVSLDFSGTVGYVQRPGSPGKDYTYYGVGVAVPYKISDKATLTGAVNYTTTDRSNNGTTGFNDQDQIVYSIGISVGF